MSDHASTAGHADAGHTHHPNYFKVYAALLVLLAISITGPMIGIQIVTLITAFGIAVVKAYLVARNFMHIDVAARYVSYLVLTMLVFMFLFFAGASPDVMKPEGRNWVKPSWVDGSVHPSVPAAHGAPEHP
jgi:caa(3)-type oxidase subunit IV